MLIHCPDCDREVSDRAHACPGCGFPIAEHVREQAVLAARVVDRTARERIGDVDCARCEARGFCTTETDDGAHYEWCRVCEHTGRVALCRSPRGWFAVADRVVDEFIAGTRDDGDELAFFLGADAPAGHRYPAAGKRVRDE